MLLERVIQCGPNVLHASRTFPCATVEVCPYEERHKCVGHELSIVLPRQQRNAPWCAYGQLLQHSDDPLFMWTPAIKSPIVPLEVVETQRRVSDRAVYAATRKASSLSASISCGRQCYKNAIAMAQDRDEGRRVAERSQ